MAPRGTLLRRAAGAATAVALLGGLLGACGSSGAATSSGATAGSTVPVGLITSFTGPQAAGFTTVDAGFLSRIDLQNSRGGVDGHRIKVVKGDDQGTPSGALSAAQTLVGVDHVLAIGAVSTVLEGASPYLHDSGVPVVGSPIDSDEWAPPNTNMFPTYGSYSPRYPAPRWVGSFFAEHGAHTVAVIGFDSPASVADSKNAETSVRAAGLKVGYVNSTIPPTQEGGFEDMVSQMKSAGVDGVFIDELPTAAFALLTEMSQAGLHPQATMNLLAPPAAVFQNAGARVAAKGTWTWLPWVPSGLGTPATRVMQAALTTYAHQTAAPDRNEYDGWAAASAVIRGLEAAGSHPTRASFITGLRKVDDFTADGVLVKPLSFTTGFGTGAVGAGPAPGDCVYVERYTGTTYDPQARPICGGLIPDSDAG